MTDAVSQVAATRGRWRMNPIWQKSVRSRLRLKYMLSWGVVTLTLTAFVSLMVYLTMTQQELASSKDAAMAVLPAIIVIQAVLMMMFGTGAVASGISQERDEGLLDYQRMTPMRPTAKILGYLFGLPVREYALFAMTLPIMAVAVVVSGFSLLTLAHFYLVFFTSVWVYHMTAMVAGMVAPKPRLASMLSIGLVAILYFVLPNLSRLGITFFEFLTIRPTFFGLLQQEMPEHMRMQAEASGIDSFRDVPFFGGLMHPTLYTLVVQGFLIATLFSMVHRKWRNPAYLVFSKGGALAVFFGVVLFMLASLWAIVTQDEAYKQIFDPFDSAWRNGQRSPETLQLLLTIFVGIVGVSYFALISAVTSSRNTAIEGWRRVRKLDGRRLGLNSDAASSLPVALVMLGITLSAAVLLMRQVAKQGLYYEAGPGMQPVLVLVGGCIGGGLFVQGLREWLGLRAFGLVVFLLWMLPFFAMMILYAAFEAWVAGTYFGMFCPPVLQGYSIGVMMESTTTLPGVEGEFLPSELAERAAEITAVGAAGYVLAGLAVQVVRARVRSKIRALGLGAESGRAAA